MREHAHTQILFDEELWAATSQSPSVGCVSLAGTGLPVVRACQRAPPF